jgi:hypothetical protein
MLSAAQKMLSDILLSRLMSHVHAGKTLAIVIACNARTDQTLIRHFAFFLYIERNIRHFDGSHPDVARNYQNRIASVKHNLIYSLTL